MRSVIYHSFRDCLGHWRPSARALLSTLDEVVGTGKTIPCGRCFHGARPERDRIVYVLTHEHLRAVGSAT